MSNQISEDDDIISDCQEEESKPIVDIKPSNFSERISSARAIILRKIHSENQIKSRVDYDDLCGPWIYPRNPFYGRYVDPPRPSLCIWKYFTQDDVTYLKKHQENRNVILSFFEHKLSNVITKEHDFFMKLLWECFKFTRLHFFTEKSVSACLGIVYLTHLFFLSYPWWTIEDIQQFFYETTLLHVILDPPRSLEIFAVNECKLMFELFHKTYMKNLVLLRIVCHPNYYFTLKL